MPDTFLSTAFFGLKDDTTYFELHPWHNTRPLRRKGAGIKTKHSAFRNFHLHAMRKEENKLSNEAWVECRNHQANYDVIFIIIIIE